MPAEPKSSPKSPPTADYSPAAPKGAVGVVTGVLPVTGAALPFFSYGGTALLILLAEMGVMLSISRYIPAKKAG